MRQAWAVGCLFFAGVLLGQGAIGQVLYKSTLPDGRVVYGDKPDPRAAKVEALTPDTSKGGIGGATQRETEALRSQGAPPSGATTDDRLLAARKALQEAEAALAAGREPLPDERIGTAGGASRLTDAYETRQRQLEQAVEKARRDLEQASRAN